MSKEKLLIQLLEASEKREFDIIVKKYLQVVFGYQSVIITDGKDDIGVDIKCFDINGKTHQYQLTTQKRGTLTEIRQFDKKIKEDLIKASTNIEEYSYSNTLYFFCSKKLTNKVIRGYEKFALENHDINLRVIDGNTIAQEADDYVELQSEILTVNNFEDLLANESVFPDRDKNLIFDLIGLGSPSDFKMHVIESFLLQSLYPNILLSKEEIIELCKKKFQSDENDVFYNKLIQRLQTSKRIIQNKTSKKYELSNTESEHIKKLNQQFDIDEGIFIKNVKDILHVYQQDEHIDKYIEQLKKVYVDSYNSNVSGRNEGFSEDYVSIYPNSFLEFVSKKNVGDVNRAKEIIIELFKVCDENKFLQKFCAGKVYSERTNLTRLSNYIISEKRVFVDTQIILNALCYFYDPTSEYENHFYQVTKSLIEFCKRSKIPLYVPDRYLWEADNHIQEAFNLIPFTNLPNFSKLGRSRNVFFNFYLNIDRTKVDAGYKYADFFKDLKFSLYDKYLVRQELAESYLSNLGIRKVVIEKGYNIEQASRLIEMDVNISNKYKTKFATVNDAIVMEFLGDSDVEVHALQPIFCTWDKTFFNIQKKYFEKNSLGQKWHLFTPGRLIDKLSLLNFSINSETLTRELIAMLSSDIVKNTTTLLDSISTILNPDNEVGLVYTNKLAEIRNNEIYKIEQHELVPPDEFEGEAVIDDVFFRLSKYYQNDNKRDDFKDVFTIEDYVNDVIVLIESAVTEFYDTKKISDTFFQSFDNIVFNVKKIKGNSLGN